MKKPKYKWLQPLLLFVMLVVLPGGSWFYLSAGFDRFQSSIAELKDYGNLPEFHLTTLDGQPIDSSVVNGQMTLVSFITPSTPEADARVETLKLIHTQFDERNDFKLLIHLLGNADARAFQQASGLTDEQQVYFATGNATELQRLMGEVYRIPDLDSPREDGEGIALKVSNGSAIRDYPYYILIDEKGVIRNYYHTDRKADIDKLVEQIALTLPRNIEGDPRLRREREK